MKFTSQIRGAKVILLLSALIGTMAMAEEFKIKIPKGLSGEGRAGDVLKSAKYDADKEVMVVEIESDNACNYDQAFLAHERSGKALFGPHIYEIRMGLMTMKGCGQRSTATLKIPLKKSKAVGSLLIHLPDGEVVAAEGTEKFVKKVKIMGKEIDLQSSNEHKNVTSSTEAPKAPGRKSEVNEGRD